MIIGMMVAANVRTPSLVQRSHPSSISMGEREKVANGYKSLYAKRSQVQKRTQTRWVLARLAVLGRAETAMTERTAV
jgi:hypothetical protein